jgi:hypothetical protein
MKKPVACAIVTLLALLSSARAEGEPEAKQPTFAIRIYSTLECDSSGKLTFFDSPTPASIFEQKRPKPREIQVRLGPEALSKVEAAASEFLKNPPPFWVGYPTASDQIIYVTEVRKGDLARVACVEGEFMPYSGISTPPELFAFRQALADAIAAADMRAEDAQSRDKVLAFLRRPGKGPPPTSRLGREIRAISNADAATLIANVMAKKDLRHKRLDCLYIISRLDGAPGNQFYDAAHDKTAGLSDDDRLQLLNMSLMAGSVKGLTEFPRLLHAQMSSQIEQFPAELERMIRQRVEPTSLPALAVAVGEKGISYRNAMKAWDWMVDHPDRLKFNPQSRQFQIVSAK